MRKALLFFAVFIALCGSDAIAAKKPGAKKESTAATLFRLHPNFRGSKEATDRQNKIADEHNLPRIRNQEELDGFIAAGYLVKISPEQSDRFYIDAKELKENFRYLAPGALDYLRIASRNYSRRFGGPKDKLPQTSAVRTVAHQKFLRTRLRNPNAVENSVHTTGYAFDISTKGMNRARILWLADLLACDVDASLVDVIYEYKAQHNFHIFVIPPKPFQK